MDLLYSDILPLGLNGDKSTIIDCFKKEIEKADQVEIAVGYISEESLKELDRLVREKGVSKICLNIGMYYFDGLPEKTYHLAMRINKKWQDLGIGEIRMVNVFKYHGKIYCFYKDGKPCSSILGSANLSVIKLDANNRRQYEVANFIEENHLLEEISNHISELKKQSISANIGEIEKIKLIREENKQLNGIQLVTPVPNNIVEHYKQSATEISFSLELKVPSADERFMDDGRHYTKSNINVCYAAPRSVRKSRDWYETQLTVGASIYKMEGYPQRNQPFFVITDDGYWFKAHTTSDNNKQFSAVGDELIMGRWLKGRLVAAGIVKPVNNTAEDTERYGMITKEMLHEYGCTHLLFKKTDQTALDEDGNRLNVWMLSFTGNVED